ncbi:MAG: hypothetical protein LBQ77_03655 [Treponema sp.]|jgi:hypothetical protein|nr:hypothetical protein [Treponema sp.]
MLLNQKKDPIDFDDIVHLTVEIDKIMRDRDKCGETIQKIESLRKTAYKVVTEYDPIDLYILTLRRIAKEILMQLVQNG